MKTINLLTIIILLVFSSCSQQEKEWAEGIKQKLKTREDQLIDNFKVYKIDNCEYIGQVLGYDAVLTHKGNCSNPIHNNYNTDYQLDIKDNQGILYDENHKIIGIFKLEGQLDSLILKDNQ